MVGRGTSWVNDLQAEVTFEHVEIAIAVEQLMVIANAIGRDQQVDGGSHRAPACSKTATVCRRFSGEMAIDDLNHFEPQQLGLNGCGLAIIPQTLKHVGEYRGGESEPLAIEIQIEPLGLGVGDAVEEIDPDR